MPRTARAPFVLLSLALAACGGGRGASGEADSAAVARPPAEAPADATPWQPRDSTR